MKRDSAAVIFRTVVFAGAMLAVPACSKKPAPQAPTQPTAAPAGNEGAMKMEGDKKPAGADDHGEGDPCAGDPCGGGERPRGSDDDGGGGVGRGFILS